MFKSIALLVFAAVCLTQADLVTSWPFDSYGAPVAAVSFRQPTLAAVGAVIGTVPTSVSHASHAVVHKSDQLVQDVVSPDIKTTYTIPIPYSCYATAPAGYAPHNALSAHK